MRSIALALVLAEVAPAPEFDEVIDVEAAPAPVAIEPPPTEIEPASPVAIPSPPHEIPVAPTNYRLVLVGDVLVGLGGAGFLTMAAGLVVRSDARVQRDAQQVADEPDPAEIDRQQRRLELGNGLAIAGGVTAGVLMAAGIGMIIGGRTRERRRRAVELGVSGLALHF